MVFLDEVTLGDGTIGPFPQIYHTIFSKISHFDRPQ